jgi:hypothetical protein
MKTRYLPKLQAALWTRIYGMDGERYLVGGRSLWHPVRASLQQFSVLHAVYHDAAPVHPPTGCGEPRLRSTHLTGGLMIVSRFISSTFRYVNTSVLT